MPFNAMRRIAILLALFFWGNSMFLLYLDDSGQIDNVNDRYCVLGGCCVFERKTHWIEQDMNGIARRRFPDFNIEFHGSAMRAGKGVWRGIPQVIRIAAIHDVLDMVASHRFIRIFAAVVDKRNAAGIDIAEHMFMQIASRFDMFLKRLYIKRRQPERGIIIFDKNKSERQIQRMCRVFKSEGHRFGCLRNMAEVPLFLDSEESRLLQLADLISFSIFRHYEHQDEAFFMKIKENIDAEGGVIHGLHVL